MIYWYSLVLVLSRFFFFFKQKTAYERRISDWSSDVCSSDLDGEASCGREGFEQLLVLFGELPALAVREIEVPEHLASDAGGYAEEAAHRRVVRGEARCARVVADLGDPDRVRLRDQRAQKPVPAWQMPDGVRGLVVETDEDELVEPAAGCVDTPESTVFCLHQVHRRLDDAAQHRRQLDLSHDVLHSAQEVTKKIGRAHV